MDSTLNFDSQWQKIEEKLQSEDIPLHFEDSLTIGTNSISILVEVDPGGGFEGGYELTSVTAAVPVQFTSISADIKNDTDEFTFSVHDEGLLDRVGKFFGMQDVKMGDEDFDKNIIVKTNDPERTKQIFEDPEVRNVFKDLKYFSFQIENDSDNVKTLEFLMDKAVANSGELKKIVHAFVKVYNRLMLQ